MTVQRTLPSWIYRVGHWRVLHWETCVGDTHTGHNIETWKGAIEKNSLFDVVSSVVLLLCLCANHSLSIRDTWSSIRVFVSAFETRTPYCRSITNFAFSPRELPTLDILQICGHKLWTFGWSEEMSYQLITWVGYQLRCISWWGRIVDLERLCWEHLVRVLVSTSIPTSSRSSIKFQVRLGLLRLNGQCSGSPS